MEMKTWQWSMVRPTKLRLYYMYSEVGQQSYKEVNNEKYKKCGSTSESHMKSSQKAHSKIA